LGNGIVKRIRPTAETPDRVSQRLVAVESDQFKIGCTGRQGLDDRTTDLPKADNANAFSPQ
jgi:hypothetical protein